VGLGTAGALTLRVQPPPVAHGPSSQRDCLRAAISLQSAHDWFGQRGAARWAGA